MIVAVLGHRLESDAIHHRLRNRVDAGIKVLRDENAAYLLVTGGKTNSSVPEAECERMRDYALERGVDSERILLEDQARDTIGNGYFAHRTIDRLAEPIDTVHVVSSESHLERATYVFEQCFGPEFTIRSTGCDEPTTDARQRHEARRLERTRAFFQGVTPGDLAAIRHRLVAEHDCYERASFGPIMQNTRR